MAFIKFKNKKSLVEAQAKKLDNHRIEISGCAINTSGFLYYQDKEMKRLYGDYSDFTTLYQEVDEGFILSDNGSVYPEPVEPEPEPLLRDVVENMEVELTDMQLAMTENFEQGIVMQEELTNAQVAITELYELILGGM